MHDQVHGSPDQDVIDRAMRVAREFCGLELAYVSEFRDGSQHIRHHIGDVSRFAASLDGPIPLEATHCLRMVDGRLPGVIPDLAADERTAVMPITSDAGVGAYVGAPIRLPDGRLYGTLCCIDPTARRELSERHRELVQLLAGVIGDEIGRAAGTRAVEEAQNAFLAAVSHDLRTPLKAIEFLAEDLADGHARRSPEEVGRVVGDEVRTVLGMVDDVLLVSGQRSGSAVLQRAATDLTEVVRDAVRSSVLAAGAGGDRVRVELPDGPLGAEVDGPRVAQAVRNLVDNALKYSPVDSVVLVRLGRDGTTAVVDVEDRGIGVAPEDVDRLVERFYRGAGAVQMGVDGIGLGLATVQSIAEAHEGVLSVSSEPGEGAAFRLRLPLAQPA
ncbi:GAF domain-containing sensor histidine kinase [Patulibacter sp.]|uniref:GAF domain-containing sensor histidine kinase n=1 Tax=Patulibacter sp. TaxID=1912859 RepID=UPI0027188F02|nr:GAF domain-containing sensor histidine kinase [Patulibacter sp.]MDO9406828.1 GAF domain-containing sensor histidine kinase [Patulibacter sp.]